MPKRVERKVTFFPVIHSHLFGEWVFIFSIFGLCALIVHYASLATDFFGRERNDEKRNRATTIDGFPDPRRAETPGVKAEKNHRASFSGRTRRPRRTRALDARRGEPKVLPLREKKPLGASRRRVRGARDPAARAEGEPKERQGWTFSSGEATPHTRLSCDAFHEMV